MSEELIKNQCRIDNKLEVIRTLSENCLSHFFKVPFYDEDRKTG